MGLDYRLEDVVVGIQQLMDVQAEGASNLPAHLLELDQADFRTAALGAFVELGELVNEAQWKPWRKYGDPTPAERQRVLKELGDVLHFLPWMIRNLGARFGITAHDVALAFMEAHEENVRRFKGQVAGREPPPSVELRQAHFEEWRAGDSQVAIIKKVAQMVKPISEEDADEIAALLVKLGIPWP